jgi:predicted ester cyclase
MDDVMRERLIGKYIAAYNTFDIDGMAAVLAPEICFENYSGGEKSHTTRGIDEFLQLAHSSKSLFSEREQKISQLIHGADSVAANIEFRGRLAVDIPGGSIAGTVLEISGTSEFWFDGARISKVIDRA